MESSRLYVLSDGSLTILKIIFVTTSLSQRNPRIKVLLSGKYRSSRPGVFCKIGVIENFATFTGTVRSLIFDKVAGFATLLKKRLRHRCFPANIAKFLR